MLQELEEIYMDKLEELAQDIQSSDELRSYLDEEEEEFYNRLKEIYEAKIGFLYDEVAAKHPLQLVYFEKVLLHNAFEGLFLPKILGHSVLRGEVNERTKYVTPQEHFAEVLMAICNSANFELLKKRIGQSIQIGFALSSDIWITNLLNDIENKKIKSYLKAQKQDRFRDERERKLALERYRMQFRSDNYQCAEFPETVSELKVMFSPLKQFLLYRIQKKYDNTSILPFLLSFVTHEDFIGTDEHLQALVLFAGFFDLKDEEFTTVKSIFNRIRVEKSDFEEKFFNFLLQLHQDNDFQITERADYNISAILDKSIEDTLKEYYSLMDMLHGRGYQNDEVQEAVRVFDSKHAGRSIENECIRRTIYNYLRDFVSKLSVVEYPKYFEVTKIFSVYKQIFANQQFNQDFKEISMTYLQKLLKHFTDKRGKDYQDIKKFVAVTFLDFEFLKEKEIVEMFKTRKKKVASA